MQVVMHNERDGVCAIGCHKTISQGDTDENGQRYTQQWGAETVGCISNDMIANDWVIGGSFEYKFKRSNVQSSPTQVRNHGYERCFT